MSRTTFSDRLLASAHRAAARIASEQRADGSFGPRHADLTSYAKCASLFLAAGRWDVADRALDLVAQRFMREDGSFSLSDGDMPPPVPPPVPPSVSAIGLPAGPPKGPPSVSAIGLPAGPPKGPPASYPGYSGGWIAMAAQRLGRFEVSEPAWSHFRRHFHPELGGCCLEGPYEEGAEHHVDMLMTAHLGLCALFFGDGEIAQRAEHVLVRFLDQQPEPAARLLLRMDGRGELVREFDGALGFAHQVEAQAAGQAWFALGYPVAFLGLLHRVTTSGEALRAARGYLEFAQACPILPDEAAAHAVAWAAALLGDIAQSPRYFDLSVAIARNLIAGQGAGGLWGEAELEPRVCFDLSAETALWLLEIARVAPIADRPERSRVEVTSGAWRRGVGAWSLRHHRPDGSQGDA